MYYIYAYCRRNFPDSSSVRLNHSPLVLKSPNGPNKANRSGLPGVMQ